eukprot:scaffold47_cov334-Pavlova_lutheri.AAC.36
MEAKSPFDEGYPGVLTIPIGKHAKRHERGSTRQFSFPECCNGTNNLLVHQTLHKALGQESDILLPCPSLHACVDNHQRLHPPRASMVSFTSARPSPRSGQAMDESSHVLFLIRRFLLVFIGQVRKADSVRKSGPKRHFDPGFRWLNYC